MAGIGFELRKYLERGSFLGTMKAYGYAGIISSGPWILSILGVLLVAVLSIAMGTSSHSVIEFLVSVTWLMAGSLMATGFLLLVFVRFVADRLFEQANDIIVPNVMGLLFFSTLVSGGIASLVTSFYFADQSPLYRLLMVANFTVLCNMWFAIIFAAGTKRHHLIITAFCLGYITVVTSALILRNEGRDGLLAGLLIGHCALLFFMLTLIFREYPGTSFMRFDFLHREKIFLRLIFIGFFYNAGLWVDKLLFWTNPATSESVIGPLRASMIYDLPIFLAYLSIIPGMAVFLVKFETDFVEAHDNYHQAIREGAGLQKIAQLKKEVKQSVREGLTQIIKVQGLTVVTMFWLAPKLISWLNISPSHLNLFYIDLVAVALQVLLLAILHVFFYLAKLTEAFGFLYYWFSAMVFTWMTLQMNPSFYGYGLCGSMLISSLVGIIILRRTLQRLEYHTFMLQI